MSRGINKQIVVGHLGKDPETVHLEYGDITKVSVATDGRSKKVGDQWIPQTEWINVAFEGKLAETASKYLKKGDQVYLEGFQETKKSKDGRYFTGLVVNPSYKGVLNMLGGAKEPSLANTHQNKKEHGPADLSKDESYQRYKSIDKHYANAKSGDFNDEIPF